MSTWHGRQGTKLIKQNKFLFAITFLVSTFLIQNFSLAQFSNAAFWSKHVFTVRFTTSPQSLLSGNCSGVTTVQLFNPQGVIYNALLDTTVSLNAPVTTNFFSDDTCTTAISSVTIAAGSNSTNFYFTDDSVGSVSLSVAATGFKTGIQNETLSANPFVWTGGGGNANWSTANNWSGAAAPSSSNRALFNGICSSNCSPTISSNINVGGVRIAGTYAGTITQAAGQTITIQSYGWQQLVGTFAGGNSAFTVNGSYGLGGGTFTSTSTNLTIANDLKVSNSPTFNANSGTYVVGTGSKTITPGNINFNNVTFSGGGYDYPVLVGNMNVQGTLATNNNDGRSSMNGGTILLSGDLNFNNYGYSGSTKIKLVGSSNQTIFSTVGTPIYPSLEFASAGGTISITNSCIIYGNFENTSGVVAVSSGTTITFQGYGYSQSVKPGGINFYNVNFFNGPYDAVNLTGTMNVTNDLRFHATDGRQSTDGGTIAVQGNVYSDATYYLGTVLIKLVGSGNQTLSGADGNAMASLEIASTGGTVTFANSFSIVGSFLYTSGTVDMGTTTQSIASNQFINSGPVNFYNLTFVNGAYNYMSVNGTVHVTHDLNFSAIDGRSSVDNGTAGLISVGGNVNITTGLNSGNVPIEYVGTGVQTITSVGGSNLRGNRTVNSASSVVTLGSNMNWTNGGQTLTVTAGSFNLAGYNLAVNALSLNSNTLTKNSGVLTVNGSVAGTGSLFGGTVNP